MRIYTRAGDLAFSTSTFSDGQPHFKLETHEVEFDSVTIETTLKNPLELFTLDLAVAVLRASGYSTINLDIRYLLGARMDRAISSCEPFTLSVVARVLNSCGFGRIRILDAHSEAATRLIRNSENILPLNVVKSVIASCPPNTIVVAPDKGSIERVKALSGGKFVQCAKVREMSTGKLSDFKVTDDGPLSIRDIERNNVLIVDDICDGGGTFVGLADKLRAVGALKVFLFVTHGIFSKDVPLDGIERIYTTNSFCTRDCTGTNPIGERLTRLTVIPISMKDL